MRKSLFIVIIMALLSAIVCACSQPVIETPEAPQTPPEPVESAFAPAYQSAANNKPEVNLDSPSAEEAAIERENTLLYASHRIEDTFGEGFPAMEFVLWLENGPFSILPGELRDVLDEEEMSQFLRTRTGESLHVLSDRFYGLLDSPETAAQAGIYLAPVSSAESAVLAFSGDVNLVDGGGVINTYRAKDGRLEEIFTGGLLDEMLNADVFVINNEFAFTTRGSPIPNKDYTFRSNPKNVSILQEIGVDAACLANNHIFDYGETGLFDTLDTLDLAGIARYGAGRDVDEAARPAYFIANGVKVAILGASCIDIRFTQVANKNQSGVLRARENNAERLLQEISTASEKSDFVVVTLHWGFENTTTVEAYQRQLAKMCIDAGADAVIGTHPHILQGAEFYNGKPIIYSLGNYWFSSLRRDTGLLMLMVDLNGGMTVRLLPCVTAGSMTAQVHGEEAERVLKFYEDISFGVSVLPNGVLTPKT